MKTWHPTSADIMTAARVLADRCYRDVVERTYRGTILPKGLLVYGIPRGGVPVAYSVLQPLREVFNGMLIGESIMLTDDPKRAHVIVDDIVCTGSTRDNVLRTAPQNALFYSLYTQDAVKRDYDADWVVFPWENTLESSAEDIPRRLLQYIGENPDRGGLLETPARFLKAWNFWTKGYHEKPQDVLKVFEDGAESVDELVLVKDIPVYSHCEHHLAPFFGKAHVGYIPNGRIVGLSKLSRLVDVYARRLQVQERLTTQVADALDEHLQPKGVGVVIECQHMCMESRGIQRAGAVTVTSAVRGVLKADASARAEFLRLIR